jgi:hypothetical protein
MNCVHCGDRKSMVCTQCEDESRERIILTIRGFLNAYGLHQESLASDEEVDIELQKLYDLAGYPKGSPERKNARHEKYTKTWISTGTEYVMPEIDINNDQYERDLAERQKRHLDGIQNNFPKQPCMHDSCQECHGTGLRSDGSMCVHGISCPCPKCSPRC